MRSTSNRSRPALGPADDIDRQIARIAVMNIDALRSEWRKAFASNPPAAFSKDLLARALSYRLQEQATGGLSASTARLLRTLLRTGAKPPRQVKAGSVIVREHKGVTHEVLVTPDGFCWRGKTYPSLSTIAKKITGVTWNGPRFFGLRVKKEPGEAPVRSEDPASSAGNDGRLDYSGAAAAPSRSGRRSSLRAGSSGNSGARP